MKTYFKVPQMTEVFSSYWTCSDEVEEVSTEVKEFKKPECSETTVVHVETGILTTAAADDDVEGGLSPTDVLIDSETVSDSIFGEDSAEDEDDDGFIDLGNIYSFLKRG